MTTFDRQCDADSPELLLASRIEQRTGKRLRSLRIARTGDRVSVHALAPTYYVKQLALQALLEARSDLNDVQLHGVIDVCFSAPDDLK
jgi:hypothetical protein